MSSIWSFVLHAGFINIYVRHKMIWTANVSDKVWVVWQFACAVRVCVCVMLAKCLAHKAYHSQKSVLVKMHAVYFHLPSRFLYVSLYKMCFFSLDVDTNFCWFCLLFFVVATASSFDCYPFSETCLSRYTLNKHIVLPKYLLRSFFFQVICTTIVVLLESLKMNVEHSTQ